MRLIIGLFLALTFNYCFGQPWFSRIYNITGGQEVAKAMTLNGDSIYIRGTYLCDTNLCTILGVYSQSGNDFLKVNEYEGIQTGLKNIMQNDSFLFISSEERNLNKFISISKIDKYSFELSDFKELRIDSSKYFSYVIGPCIEFVNNLIVGANALDSSKFINYQGWNNYQEKAILFVLDYNFNIDSIAIIPPSSGAFLKIEDMVVGTDSILYISFYEKYLKQGNPDLFLEIRKVIYGYDQNMQKVFQWVGPDFDVPESISCIAIDKDNILYHSCPKHLI